MRVLQRRPTNLVDVWDQGRYRRVLTTTDGPVLVEVANDGTIDDPQVRAHVLRGKSSVATLATIRHTLRNVLGLDVDPEPLQRLAEAEHRLVTTALALRGMRPPRFVELFEAFASVVPFQQVSLDAGVAIVRRLVERFGDYVDHQGRRCYAFPTARVVANARLDAIRACGISHRKADTLRRLARAIESAEVTEEKLSGMTSADAIQFLSAQPGIGPWSASLVLLRGLGRLDVFPPGDVGVTRGLRTILRLGSSSSFDRIIQRFGAYRGYLYFYSLGSALLARDLIHPAPPPPS